MQVKKKIDIPNSRSIPDRIKELMGRRHGAQSEFGRRTGITQPYVSQLLAGSQPGPHVLEKIAKAYHVSLDWLVLGKGSKSGEPEAPGVIVATMPQSRGARGGPGFSKEIWKAQNAVAVPCPAVANAGEPIVAEEYLDKDSEKHYIFRWRFLQDLNRSGDWICIVVDPREGDSMKPTLSPGDLLLIDRNLSSFLQSPRSLMRLNGTIALLANPDDSGLFVKRIWIETEGRLIAQSDNIEFPAKSFSLEGKKLDEIIVGRVVWRGHAL